jgi:hypothetical protein
VGPENIGRLVTALEILDARYRKHTALRPTAEDLAAGGHLLLMTNCGPLDVLGFIGGDRRYEDVAESAERLSVGDASVRVLPIESSIEEKRALGRDKDLLTVRILEAVLRQRENR